MIEIIVADDIEALVQHLASRLLGMEAENKRLAEKANAWKLVAESLMGVEKEY